MPFVLFLFIYSTTTPTTPTNVTANNYRLLAVCDHCANTTELSVKVLIKAHRRNYPVPRIKRRLKCMRCQSDSCAVQVALTGSTRQVYLNHLY